MNTVRYDVCGPVAVLTMNNPPANGLGYALRCGIVAGLDRALADPAMTAVVLTGGESLLSGGADILEFGSPATWRLTRVRASSISSRACPNLAPGRSCGGSCRNAKTSWTAGETAHSHQGEAPREDTALGDQGPTAYPEGLLGCSI